MKICIFGAGAIGGYMGAKLAEAGADVSLVARGPHLAAMKDKGLTLIEEGEAKTYKVNASDNAADLGRQDYVIVTLKAHSVPPVVPKMQPLIGEGTTIVSGVNGVPWWYFYKHGGDLEGALGWITRWTDLASGSDAAWAARADLEQRLERPRAEVDSRRTLARLLSGAERVDAADHFVAERDG